MHKKLVIAVCVLGLQLTSPVLGAVPLDSDPGAEPKGAKQLTPVLDMAGQELKRVGTKLLDNAVYSIEHLWKDTVNLTTGGKKSPA